MGCFEVKSGRGRKWISSTSVDDVAMALQERMSIDVQTCNAQRILPSLDRPVSMVHKIMRNILLCYPYEITHVQELLPADLLWRQMFALEFLTDTDVDKLPWNILWTDEAHLHLQGFVNTKNYRIWAKENLFATQPVLTHSTKVRSTGWQHSVW